MLMSAADYRESLRSYQPRVFVDGDAIASVADEPRLAPGINAIGVTYDYALDPAHAAVALAPHASRAGQVNRFIALNRDSNDLLAKLEYTRLTCQETGCAMRYLSMDGLNALWQIDASSRCAVRAVTTTRACAPISKKCRRRPDGRHRHDRCQGRPQPAAAPAAQPHMPMCTWSHGARTAS
jgi:hypothetical protein